MKINNKKINIIPIAIAIIVVVLIIVAAGTVYSIITSSNSTTDSQSSSQTPSKDDTNNTSGSPSSESGSKPSTPNSDQSVPVKKDESTGKSIVQMVASVDVTSNFVYIRGGANNLVPGDGSCFAQLKGPNLESMKETTDILQNARTSDCKTITIATSALAKGTWRFTLNYSSSNMQGQSDEITFEIK